MKKQVVIDVCYWDEGFRFSLHSKTRDMLGMKDGIRAVILSCPVSQNPKFKDFSRDVLLMVVRMLCEGRAYWDYDLRFRNPKTRKTLIRARYND